MGVAGGVCVSDCAGSGEFIISDVDDSEEAEDVISPVEEDFEEESILSVLLRLPPIPDSGVGTFLGCLSSLSVIETALEVLSS